MNLGPLAPINPDGSNAPMCRAPGCYQVATKRSPDFPLDWCERHAGTDDMPYTAKEHIEQAIKGCSYAHRPIMLSGDVEIRSLGKGTEDPPPQGGQAQSALIDLMQETEREIGIWRSNGSQGLKDIANPPDNAPGQKPPP